MSLKASITMMRGFMPTGLVNKSVMTDEVGAYLNTFLSQTHSNRRGGGGAGSTDIEKQAAETFNPHEHGNKA